MAPIFDKLFKGKAATPTPSAPRTIPAPASCLRVDPARVAFAPDWRWMRERDDTPWYSSMKLYRQRAVGDWPAVFKRIATDLHQEFPAG
jgi:hypothetical protein